MRSDDLELARLALSKLSPVRADARESWIKVGMALHAVSVSLLADWIQWSRQSDKFQEGECERQWRSFKRDKAGNLGIGSLIRWAREDSGDSDFGKVSEPDATTSFVSLEAAIAALQSRVAGTVGGMWLYETRDGTPSFWIVRVNLRGHDAHGKPRKTFRPIRIVRSRFEIGDPPGLLPLFGLPRLPADGTVFGFEGEKCAVAGARIGLASTASAHGAGAVAKSDWSPLAGRDVVIVRDNDEDGRRYAERARAALLSLDPPAAVRIVDLPDVPVAGDIVDFIAARRVAGKQDEEIRAEIEALAAAAATSGGFAGGLGGDFQEFPEPIPLPNATPPVAAFSYDFVPPALSGWIRDIAERMQCAADFVFAAAIVGLSAVLGRKVGIRPKRLDEWTVVANLWGAVVARPSLLKSPAIQEALKPLLRLEREAKERFDADKRSFEASTILAAARRKSLEKDLHQAIRDGGDGLGIAREIANEDSRPPTRRRYIVNDATVEKLGEILNENSNGVLCFRDEMTGLLRSLDKDGQEGARAFYLQAWNGDGRYTYDRIGRGTIDIEAAIVSMFGGIQPGPLAQYIVAATNGGSGADGLLQRIQVLVYPDPPGEWKNHDRPADRRARELAFAVFRYFDELDPESVGAACDPDEPDGIPFLHFAEDAQPLFDEWRKRLELHLRAAEEDEAFESHLGKYRSLVPSLALIYHGCEFGTGPITAAALERAIATAEYLESHARRVYAHALTPELSAARALAAKLLARRVNDPFVLRDVYQNGWSALSTKQLAQSAVEVLLDLGWVLPAPKRDTGGAPRTEYRINPRIWKKPDPRTSKTSTSPPPAQNQNHADPRQGTCTTGRSLTPTPCECGDGERATFTTDTSPPCADCGLNGAAANQGDRVDDRADASSQHPRGVWLFDDAVNPSAGVHDA